MNIWRFARPSDSKYATAVRCGTWEPKGMEICPKCSSSRQKRIQPLLIEQTHELSTWLYVNEIRKKLRRKLCKRCARTSEANCQGPQFFRYLQKKMHKKEIRLQNWRALLYNNNSRCFIKNNIIIQN